jgi:hypothetical protein
MAYPPPQKRQFFVEFCWPQLEATFFIPRPIQPKPSHPMVDCGMFEYFDGVH